MASTRAIKSAALILISLFLLFFGVKIAGFDEIIYEFSKFSFLVIAIVFFAFVANLLVVALRLHKLLEFFGISITYSVAMKASIQGHFASLFFISLFGQVAGRQAVLRHYGTPAIFVASLTAIERIVLFIISSALGLLGAAWILDYKEIGDFLGRVSLFEIGLVIVLSFLASLWFGRSHFESRLLAGLMSDRTLSKFLSIAAISFFAQLFVLLAFVAGAYGLNAEINFWSLLAAAAVTSFAASLPISVNGWGVREIAAIFAFGHVGMPASSALAVSILVGLCSTAVVLAAWPYAFAEAKDNSSNKQKINLERKKVPIEKIASWGLITAASVLIFFQVYIPLQEGIINFNLADPFAILALAAIAVHGIFTRQAPVWKLDYFNVCIVVMSILLFLAFINGLRTIGVTEWALVGRLMGWLVLLGYLSIGVIAVSYLGRQGIWRVVETLVATAVVVILFHALMRWIALSGWYDIGSVSLNFQGYSVNRNALAFQLLTCSVLFLAFASREKALHGSVALGWLRVPRDHFLAAAHGIVLAGLVFTASRAGIVTGLVVFVLAGITGFVDRKLLFRSAIYAATVWGFFVFALPLGTQVINGMTPGIQMMTSSGVAESGSGRSHARSAAQSPFSDEASNQERWETLRRGIELWRESPLVGQGLGVFIEKSTEWSREPIVIHSTPVWILAEFGLVGAIILTAIFSWLVFRSIKIGFADPGIRAMIMLFGVFLIFGLVHEIFYQRIFWLALGICLALPIQGRLRNLGMKI